MEKIMSEKLTHIDREGNARMVSILEKPHTKRIAVAEGWILLSPTTLSLIKGNDVKKGDVLSIAQLAGIMATKKTADIIPLCHPIPIDGVELQLEVEEQGIYIRATVYNVWKTGVEMEALTAVTAAALTIYDMVKAVEKTGEITNIRLVSKSKSEIK